MITCRKGLRYAPAAALKCATRFLCLPLVSFSGLIELVVPTAQSQSVVLQLQAQAEDVEERTYIGSHNAYIVGVNHYRGVVTNGEMVRSEMRRFCSLQIPCDDTVPPCTKYIVA